MMNCVLSLLFLVCCNIGALSSASSDSPDSAPHILFIVADDLGYKDLGYSGAEFRTPAIDKLAEDGTILSRYYVHKMCTPTRSSLMTGKYSWKLGIPNAFTIGCNGHIPSDTPTIAELLKQSNKYNNHFVGKWHVGHASFNMTPIERGFDSSYGIFQGETDFYTHSLYIGGYDFFDGKDVNKQVINDYSADLYVSRVKKILNSHVNSKRANKKSLFIYLSFQLVHAPLHIPPETSVECNRHTVIGESRRTFCNMVLYMDNSIKKIENEMKRLGLFKDTIVIFTSDNGGLPNHNNNFEYGSDDPTGVSSLGCNLPYRGGKRTNFEGGVHVLSFISGGALKNPKYKDLSFGNLRGRNENTMLFHAADWLPTIIKGFANDDTVTLPGDIDGENMLPALTSGNSDVWDRETLFLHFEDFGTSAALIYKNKWKYIRGYQQYTYWYHCDNIFPHNKLDLALDMRADNPNTVEWLFDLENDPYEEYNIINDESYLDIVKEINNLITDKIYNSGEYVTDIPNIMRNESYYFNYCDIWYPWLDWDGSIDCATLNNEAKEARQSKQSKNRKKSKITKNQSSCTDNNNNNLEIITEREGVYANTEWATAHGGSRNNDFISSIDEIPEYYEKINEVLGDYEAAVLLGPVRGPEGNFYMATGKDSGSSNFHCFDGQGNLLWQTLPWFSDNTNRFDVCGIFSSPVVDENGDVYISDCNQMWAFHNNGNIKWVTNLPEPTNPEDTHIFDPLNLEITPIGFGNPFFTIATDTLDAMVGGITLWGDVLLYNRETGEQMNEIINMPGECTPQLINETDGASPYPYVAHGYGSVIWTYFNGGVESSNVPAVHPITGRVYVTGFSTNSNQECAGAVHGFTITPSKTLTTDNKFKVDIVFDYEAKMTNAGSGSSPAITNDYNHLYVSDGKGVMYKFSTDTSATEVWRNDTGAQPASVTIGGPGDDKAYMFSKTSVVARDPSNGGIVWEFNLLTEAAKRLPIEPINQHRQMCDYAALPNAIPVTLPGKVIVTGALGYEVSLIPGGFLCNTDKVLPAFSLQGVWELDSETGNILRNGDMILAEDSNEAFTIPTADGLLLMDRGVLTSGINQHYYNDIQHLFPDNFKPYLPKGGIEILQGMDSITIVDNLTKEILYSVGFDLEYSTINKITSGNDNSIVKMIGKANDIATGDRYYISIDKNTNNGSIKIFNGIEKLMDITINSQSNLQTTTHSIYGTGFVGTTKSVTFRVSDWRA